jgi:hypothetical protein
MKFVPISALLSATACRSFQNEKPAAILGSLCLRRLIDAGKEKEVSTIRETSVGHALRSMSVRLILKEA